MSRPKFDPGLRILKGKVRKYKIFGFDVETCDNNKNFVCASIVGHEYKKFFEDKNDLIKELQTNQIFRGSFLCATNLMFDFFALFSHEYAIEKFSIIERSSSLILAKTYVKYKTDNNFYSMTELKQLKEDKNIDIGREYYSLTFIDSMNHLQKSVKQLGKIINLDKLPTPKFLGEFPKNEDQWTEMKNYNIRDSEITYKFMEFVQENYNKIGSNMKITISSSSMDLFRRKYLNSFWRQEPRENILECYKAYYGGRTEAFKRGIFNIENYGKIKVYDVNSLYPFELLNKYPYPKSYKKEKITYEDIESFEGIVNIKLKSPDLNIPILPVKTDKLRFPVGNIEGMYDFNSIRFAVNYGYEIEKILNGVVYEHTFSPFKNYVKDLYALRNKLKDRDDSSELIAKILMNSFYGKFGYNYSNKEKIISVDDLKDYDMDKIDIYPYGKTGILRIKTGEESYIPGYVFPIFSLYVTSYARATMFKNFKRIGFNRLLYTDTDCIFTTRNISTSNELGELKLENTFNELCIVKPKFYSGLTIDNKDIIKVKGLHGSLESYNHFINMIKSKKFSAKTQHFRKLRTALKGKGYVNEVYNMVKDMGFEDNKRLWEQKLFTEKPQNSKPCII